MIVTIGTTKGEITIETDKLTDQEYKAAVLRGIAELAEEGAIDLEKHKVDITKSKKRILTQTI